MNTIPTTFNESKTSYTAVGGTVRNGDSGLSAIILNRGGRYLRRSVFKECEKAAFDYVISVEGPRESYDVEELSIRFPFVKFLLLKEKITLGEEINLAVSELKSPLFFILWNDTRLLQSGGVHRIAERFFSASSATSSERLCTVPTLQNSRFETLPSLIAPAFFRNSLKTIPFSPVKEGLPTLYPFDGIGIYDRERFIRMGGFDETIKAPYWQMMDFGFRAHLWGEEIRSTQLIKVVFDAEIPPQDVTNAPGYKRFYLKNLLPLFRGDSAYIPLRRFPSYLFRSGESPLAAWQDFTEARDWVQTNRFRFHCDARKVTELWEPVEP